MSTASLLVPGASAPMLGHLVAMSGLHLQGRYGRMSDDFNRLAGRAPIDMRAFVAYGGVHAFGSGLTRACRIEVRPDGVPHRTLGA